MFYFVGVLKSMAEYFLEERFGALSLRFFIFALTQCVEAVMGVGIVRENGLVGRGNVVVEDAEAVTILVFGVEAVEVRREVCPVSYLNVLHS